MDLNYEEKKTSLETKIVEETQVSLDLTYATASNELYMRTPIMSYLSIYSFIKLFKGERCLRSFSKLDWSAQIVMKIEHVLIFQAHAVFLLWHIWRT